MTVLIRHFFGRFFDRESLSPQGDPTINITQSLAFLATPGLFFIMLFMTVNVARWDLVEARCLFIFFSMLVMGIIVVFEWDTLFLDARDYQILLPLPIPLWKLFLAKATALGLFLTLFLIAANFFSTLFWPIIDRGDDMVTAIAIHFIVVVAAGFFAAFAIASVQGVLRVVVPMKAFRPVSLAFQTLLIACLVTLFFISPFISSGIGSLIFARSAVPNYVPPYWFTGFYETMRPAVKNASLRNLGGFALPSLGYAITLFLLTHLPGYRRHARRAVESLQSTPSEPGRLSLGAAKLFGTALFMGPEEQAIFSFIGKTLRRSVKHRLFLGAWAGFGAALVVINFRPERGLDREAIQRLPLMLSFVLVSGLRSAFNFPSDLRANWIFRMGNPDDSRAYRIATRKWIMACGIAPLFLLLAPLEFTVFSWPVALYQIAFGVTLSALLTETMFFGFRKIPFTCAYFPGKFNLVSLVVMFVLGFIFYSDVMAAFESALIRSPLKAIAFLLTAWVCVILASRWKDSSPGAQTDVDYDGAEDPVVRTLELTTR